MIEPLVITVFPTLFLIVLFGGGELFRRRNIDMDGDSPIDRRLFYSSKYAILLVWGATVLHSWGIHPSWLETSDLLKSVSLYLWGAGFTLLFMGRFGLGNSFRLGSPKEGTDLKVDGLFSLSRNPMYLGVYTTLLAGVLYTLNPIVFFVGLFVGLVHHQIVLAEEQELRQVFGQEYTDYCRHVRRYL